MLLLNDVTHKFIGVHRLWIKLKNAMHRDDPHNNRL